METSQELVGELAKKMRVDIDGLQSMPNEKVRKIVFKLKDEFEKRHKKFVGTSTIKRALRLWV